MKIVKAGYHIETEIDGDRMLRAIERAGRTCYKSEDRITDTSARKFVQMILERGHHSVLEHESFSVRFVCDRGVSHEIVRHRLASYSQESTRYCVAGDSKLTCKNPHHRLTVRDLYNNKQTSRNGSWKRISIRQLDLESYELTWGRVRDIFHVGKKHVVKVRTRLGYELLCTPDHELLTDKGWRAASDTKQTRIAISGGAANIGRVPWNKGLRHSKIRLFARFDSVIEVSDAGSVDVFDISMADGNQNFAANGIIVHNCNYSKAKFGKEIAVIDPRPHMTQKQFGTWCGMIEDVETTYFMLLDEGAKPQMARSILPNSLKTELVMTANLREWRHFFTLRTAPAAHPQLREITIPLLLELQAKIPVVFNDIEVDRP